METKRTSLGKSDPYPEAEAVRKALLDLITSVEEERGHGFPETRMELSQVLIPYYFSQIVKSRQQKKRPSRSSSISLSNQSKLVDGPKQSLDVWRTAYTKAQELASHSYL